MLLPLINYLWSISTQSYFSNDPWRMIFLNQLSPLHVRFHMTPLETRSLGFLTFHWCVIFYFKALGLDRLMSINPFSSNDFFLGGRFYNADTDWNVWMGNIQSVRNINDLLQISDRLERWHNSVHMSIEMVTGTPMMDASTNIYYQSFWNLHFFINNIFEEQLNSYKIATNPNLVTPFQVIQDINSSYPNLIGRI